MIRRIVLVGFQLFFKPCTLIFTFIKSFQLQVRYFLLVRGLKSEPQLAGGGPITLSFLDGFHAFTSLRVRLRSVLLKLTVGHVEKVRSSQNTVRNYLR